MSSLTLGRESRDFRAESAVISVFVLVEANVGKDTFVPADRSDDEWKPGIEEDEDRKDSPSTVATFKQEVVCEVEMVLFRSSGFGISEIGGFEDCDHAKPI